jgi:hypothetical protein
MQKINDALTALRARVDAAPAADRPALLLTGATSALAQAIADAKMAGLSDAQLGAFQAVQQAMDSDLRDKDGGAQQQGQPQAQG